MSNYIAISNEDAYLAHHGILGMKWGIRRYQNTDGSLTAAGKKRYGGNTYKEDRANDVIKAKKQAERDEKNRIKAENKAIRAERKKQLRLRRTLSDKDLLEGIGRLEKEKKYKELLKEDLERGNKDVNDVLKQSGKKVATMTLTGTALYIGQAWLKKNFDPKVAADYIFQKPSFKK